MAQIETGDMSYIRLALHAKFGRTLEDMIRAGRVRPEGASDADWRPRTWDDLAYDIRRRMEEADPTVAEGGTRPNGQDPIAPVRESLINWARRYGVVVDRQTFADAIADGPA